MKMFLRSTLVIILAVVLRPSIAQTSSDRLLFLNRGRLVVQPAAGGAITPASFRDNLDWQVFTNKPSIVSPDGKYEAVYQRDADSFAIMDRNSHSTALGAQEMHQVVNATKNLPPDFQPDDFRGWLPDSKHIVLTRFDGNSSHMTALRCIVCAVGPNPHVTRFNGWLSNDMKIAIVPNAEGMIDDTRLYVRKSGDDGMGSLQASRIKYYIVQPPKNIDGYRLTTNKAKKLILPSALMEWNILEALCTFSSDDRWCLIDCSEDHRQFLANLRTGMIRELPGTKAMFERGNNASIPTPKNSLNSIAQDQVRFLLSIKPQSNMIAIQKLLSSETYSKPEWVQAIQAWGNYIHFTGLLNGSLVFLNTHQPRNGWRESFSMTDSINYVVLHPPSDNHSLLFANSYIVALSKYLGPPSSRPRPGAAEWKLRQGRSISYYGLDAELRLNFSYTLGGEPSDFQ